MFERHERKQVSKTNTKEFMHTYVQKLCVHVEFHHFQN